MRTIMKRGSIGAIVLCMIFAMLAAPASAQPRPRQGSDSARTYGGAALGAFGGGALGSSLIAAAGIANPLLAGSLLATTTFAGTYSGAKLGALASNNVDGNTNKKAVWTAVGAVS